MKSLLIICSSLIYASSVWAAELVMFETAYCEWCEKWDRDIGHAYPQSITAKQAPLRRVEMAHGTPDDLRGLKPIIYYPTFVIVDNGKEYGRIIGYQGQSNFNNALQSILSKIPKS